MPGKYDAVIFDMDGTLVDTLAMTVGAIAKYAPQCGLPPLPREVIIPVIGYGNHEFYRALYPDAAPDVQQRVEDLVEAGELEIGRTLGPKILFPGAAEMLRRLREAGLPLFVASTGTSFHVEGCLEIGGVLTLFDRIACGEPDKIDMTAKLLRGFDPARVPFIGDSLKDVEAAHGNGLLAIGACFGYAREGGAPFDVIYDTPQALCTALLG